MVIAEALLTCSVVLLVLPLLLPLNEASGGHMAQLGHCHVAFICHTPRGSHVTTDNDVRQT